MSQENVEIVTALIPGTDIVRFFRDEAEFAQTREAIGSFLTDDFESLVVLPGETWRRGGPEGLRDNWLDWLEPWAAYRVTIDDLIDLGDRVLALTRNYGRRRDMDAEVELIGAALVTFREGKVARWEDYAQRSEALAAVGLSE
jgi:ketosteroid isomerase-like protein